MITARKEERQRVWGVGCEVERAINFNKRTALFSSGCSCAVAQAREVPRRSLCSEIHLTYVHYYNSKNSICVDAHLLDPK